VQAMREGAYDFVEKPLKRMSIVKSVRKAASVNRSWSKTERSVASSSS
jgi:FixJ family two-component response regulator